MTGGTIEEPAIRVRGLRKSYGDTDAVRGVDLDVGHGEVVAMLGPNGAGKTTTVEILEGLRRRDGGDVRVLGHDPESGDRDLKARVGVVLQEVGVEPFLTVEEIVELHRGWYPRPRPLDDVLELCGLTDVRHERANGLSGGQRRRVDVAISLAGDPEVLFLDEPTTGFDPSARRDAWEMIRGLQSTGRTILLTTHYLDEAQQLADRVVVLVDGTIVAEGPPDTLVSSAGTGATRIFARVPVDLPTPLPSIVTEHATVADGRLEVRSRRPTLVLHALTCWAVDNDVELEEIAVDRPSLEDVYLELIGSHSRITSRR